MSANWRLQAISSAAKNRKRSTFVLRAGENLVGKRAESHIKIYSVLCSRAHCSLHLIDDEITLEDYSQNGTYVNHSDEIKHYQKDDGKVALQSGDIICFGFNIGTVYNINDPNVFTYILTKESIETIDLDSDDDEATPAEISKSPRPPIDPNEIHEIDSDSEHSGEECLENIDDFGDSYSSEPSVYSNSENEYSDEASNDTTASSVGSGSFIVTKTILNPHVPPDSEVVDLLSDDENPEISSSNEVVEQATESTPDDVSMNEECESKPDSTSDKAEDDKPEQSENASVEKIAETVESLSKADDGTIEGAEQPSETVPKPAENIAGPSNDEENRLANIRKRIAQKSRDGQPKLTEAKPIRKRRRTFTETEYKRKVEKKGKKLSPQEIKQLRLEKLAKIAAEKRAEKEATDDGSGDAQRVPFVPRVKNTSVSRGAMLSTEMLGNPSPNPSEDGN